MKLRTVDSVFRQHASGGRQMVEGEDFKEAAKRLVVVGHHGGERFGLRCEAVDAVYQGAALGG